MPELPLVPRGGWISTKKTFIRAVCNGNYATWPKLTIQLIHKYMPDADETAKGHLKGQCQGI
jgi:hypothetical protein